MRNILFSANAWLQYDEIQKINHKQALKINTLLKDIARNGASGLGKPEALKGELSGCYSRRIDSKNRIVYRFDDNVCEILQVGTHYNDK